LLLNCLNDTRRTVAQEVAPPTGKKVEVPLALAVPNQRSFATYQIDRVSRVVGNHILFEEFDGVD